MEWEKVLTEAQEITSDFISDIDEVDKELDERERELHQRVNIILSDSRKTLQEMKASKLSILHDQEKYISEKVKKMKDDVRRCEDQLKDGDQNALLQYEKGTIQCNEEPPSLKTASVPSFTKGQNDSKTMQKTLWKYF